MSQHGGKTICSSCLPHCAGARLGRASSLQLATDASKGARSTIRSMSVGSSASAAPPRSRPATVVATAGPADPEALPARLAIAQAASLDFAGLPAEQLPEVIREAEAEHSRRGGWQRVLPCSEEPTRYQALFQHPRPSNVLLTRYLSSQSSQGSHRAPSACVPPRQISSSAWR